MTPCLSTAESALKLLWSLLAAALALAALLSGALAPAELLVRDAILRALPARPATHVAVVVVDEEAVRAVGAWPWSRETLARLVERTFAAGARGVAVDLLLPEAREGDAALAAALAAGPSVLAAGLDDGGRWLLPNPRLAARGRGHVSFDLDRDGVVRRFAATKQVEDLSLPALPVAAARLWDPALAVPVGVMLRPGFRARRLPVVGAAATLDGRAGEALRGRVVFLGSSAAGVGDRFVSPVSPGGSPEPGVFAEALSAEAILDGDLLRIAPPLLDALLAFALAWIGLGLLGAGGRVLPLLAPLAALAPLPLAAATLLLLRLETAPVAVLLSLLLAGGAAGVERARRGRAVLREARDRIAELEALQAGLAEAHRQDAEARRVVAHELKTPLTSVRGLAQLLASFDLEPAERDRVAGLVVAEASRLAQMVDALLDLERLRLRDFGREAQVVDLSALCAARVEVLRAGAGRALEAAIQPDLRVRGDRALLERMLENLVSNAIKFSPEGTPVELALRREASRAVLEVLDRGPGVPRQERAAIFGRFARGSARGLAPGLGLGLALVAEVVAWHRGAVGVDEAPGGGGRFRIELPLAHEGSEGRSA